MSKNTAPRPLIRPVILSGGSGTRLWPVSRHQYPKQFAPLIGEETLFSSTLRRVADRSRYAPPVIVSNAEHKFFILEALDALGIKDATILLEPQGRNTAAAAIVAALFEGENESGMLHLVMPSDHLVEDLAAFHAAVDDASAGAEDGQIVLFGITPDRPETGYGYILPAGNLKKGPVRRIDLFREKPDQANAQALIGKGALWNSGIFLYRPHALLKEAEALNPAHLQHCREAWQEAVPQGKCLMLHPEAYIAMESHALDTLFMENTSHGAVLPCSMGWNDVGSWQALWHLAKKDESSNAIVGSVVTRDVTGSYIRSEGPTVAVLGMDDCMVIATKDAVLVAPCARAQEIKGLLALVENTHTELANAHARVPRPWGTYESIAEGANFKVKHIVVKPGRSLSLQMHHHRAEHWVVVAGTAKVEYDNVEKLVFPNESVFIPRGSSHRLSNPGKIDLQLIEVQSGEYLQEDDIVRFEDVYGRATSLPKAS